MRIVSLELQNIKSYHEPTRIDFTSGVNAVCGHNGSGKTTVLEAIGYALFDFLPYNKAAFLREGERSGSIRLRFVADDEREYEIVRKLGTGQQYYVMDLENDLKLVDRGPDVLAWVQRHALGIDSPVDLEALFKNAVGVPQGLMTSDFLGTASTRKGIFDPLLRVGEYRQAFERLRDTVNYVRDLTAQTDIEIARLEKEAERIPELEGEAEALRARVGTGTAARAQLGAELATVEGRLHELEGIQARLTELDGELRGAEYDVQLRGDQLLQAQRLLDSARAAHQAVALAEPGYVLYREAEEERKQLEIRRTERDGLRAALGKIKGELDGTSRNIEGRHRELRAAKEAGVAAAALTARVDRQVELEAELGDVTARLSGLVELDERRRQLADEIGALRRDSAARADRLTEAHAAVAAAAALPETQRRVEELVTALAQLDGRQRELTELTERGRMLKDEARQLTEAARERARLRAELERLEPSATQLETLQARQQELREERAEVKASLAYGDVARRTLEERRCPLLELQCPVVTADVMVLDRLGGRSDELQKRITTIEAALSELEPRVRECQAARTESQRLEVRSAQLAAAEERLPEVRSALDACVARHNELSAELAAREELRARHVEAVQEERRLQSLNTVGQRVGDLESALAEDAIRLEKLGADAARLEDRHAALAGLQARLDEITAELAALDDPRRTQGKYLAQAALQTEIEAAIARESERREREDADYRAGVEQLQAYDTLDDELAAQAELISTHRPAYETYLTNRAEAAQISEREGEVLAAEARLGEARERQAAVAAARAEVAARYDAEELMELQRRSLELHEKISGVETTLLHDRQELRTCETDLTRLYRQREKLAERLAERGELGEMMNAVAFIRDTIRSAGPAVTETLLAHISQGANDIFADIMDDHTVELRWDREYEVLAQRGPEVRKFSQLSGGEQMSAALAVRLALLKEMSEVDFAFFDEPTQNMDEERRANLAQQISAIRGFDQLIVISHDDTFEHHTENLIRLSKLHEETQLEAG